MENSPNLVNKNKLLPFVILIFLVIATIITLIASKTSKEIRPKAAADNGTLTFSNLSSSNVPPGGTFTVRVDMNGGNQVVTGADILICYDRNKLTFLSLTKNTSTSVYKTYVPVDSSGNFDTAKVISNAAISKTCGSGTTLGNGIIEFGLVAFDWTANALTAPTTTSGNLANVSTLTFQAKTGISGSTFLSFVNNGINSTTDSNIVVNPTSGEPEDILLTSNPITVNIGTNASPVSSPTSNPTNYPSPTSTSDPGIIFKATHESGNLSEWTADSVGSFIAQGNGTYRVVETPAHNSSYSVGLTINSPGGTSNAAYLFYWKDLPDKEYYYSSWYFIPSTVQIKDWWNIWQWKHTTNGDSSTSVPMYSIGADSTNKLYLTWRPDLSSKVVTRQTLKTIPRNQWFHIEAYYKEAMDNTGQVIVWQDGTEIINVTGKPTALSTYKLYFSVNNYTEYILPAPCTIYVDDVIISKNRVGPGDLPLPSPTSLPTATPKATPTPTPTATPIATPTLGVNFKLTYEGIDYNGFDITKIIPLKLSYGKRTNINVPATNLTTTTLTTQTNGTRQNNTYGNYLFTSSPITLLSSGTYDFYLNGLNHLIRHFSQNISTTQTIDINNEPLITGDVFDESNTPTVSDMIYTLDYSNLILFFTCGTSMYNPNNPAHSCLDQNYKIADLNFDNQVDIDDYNLLVNNFNEKGDN